jgi:opacity protein-like surface antigen
MGNWTRTNAAATQPSRSFEGDSKTNLAWSLGAGVSWNVGKNANGPIKMDLTYQYFALGNAQGGGTPLAGSGTESPVNPLEFDISSQVVSVGVRIPLNLR